jgi:ribosome-associated translation inhibitor RaiA
MMKRIQTHAVTLSARQERRIERHLHHLERRLEHQPEPVVTMILSRQGPERYVIADLRVQLGHLGEHLVSHERGETADGAARLAVEDVERQIERIQGVRGG